MQTIRAILKNIPFFTFYATFRNFVLEHLLVYKKNPHKKIHLKH